MVEKEKPTAPFRGRGRISPMLVFSTRQLDQQAENQKFDKKKIISLFRKFRIGFYRSELTKERNRNIIDAVQPRWESECAFICVSGRDATGPSRAGPIRSALMRRAEEKDDDRCRGRTAQAVQQYGVVFRIWSSGAGLGSRWNPASR